jgi:hypothetical protein
MTAAAARCLAFAAAGIGLSAACAGDAVRDDLHRVQDAPAAKPPPTKRMPQLNTLRDVGLALEICWEANEPPLAQARPGMNVTVMLTFNRKGEILGEPRFTYVTPEASQETRALYEQAVVAAINACTPLPISEALGNALAGSPKVMPFIDRRNQKGI